MALNPGEQPSGGWVIDADGRQSISIQGGTGGAGGGGGGGTEYAEGTVSAAPTGGVILWKDVGNALVAVSAAKPLPVSGPLTDAQLRAAAVPVSGTFWQATQPVSGTVTANVGTGTQPVSGSVALDAATLTALETISVANFPATQPVSGNVGLTGALPAGTNNIGDVDVLSLPALSAGSNQIGTTLGPALARGTQGATGYAVQDLKDAGRNLTTFTTANGVLTTAAETLLTLAGYKGGAAVGGTATPAVVSAGKTYRITAIFLSFMATATAGNARVALRANTAGVVAVGSAMVCAFLIGGPSFTAGVVHEVTVDVPDGLEFQAGTGIGLTSLGQSPSLGATAGTGYVTATIIGFEY